VRFAAFEAKWEARGRKLTAELLQGRARLRASATRLIERL
jgi:hypothetical protein